MTSPYLLLPRRTYAEALADRNRRLGLYRRKPNHLITLVWIICGPIAATLLYWAVAELALAYL